MFKALGDPTRARIFSFLCTKSAPIALDEDSGDVHSLRGCTIGEVCCHITGSEQFSSTISFHLKELRIAGLIKAEKKGKYTICSIERDALRAMTLWLTALENRPAMDCLPQHQESAKN
jgi:ArsR family transcriptional regulator, arsenate/arsenite/antimonite-responsive transcriptional repressor